MRNLERAFSVELFLADLTKVMGIYKRDWMRWRRAFDGYKRVMQSNQETCMMD